MPGYIETAGEDISQGDVFRELYNRAEKIRTILDGIRRGHTNDTNREAVPETPLILGLAQVQRTGRGALTAVTIYANPNWDPDEPDIPITERVQLLTQTHLTAVNHGQPVELPVSLGAYRGTTTPRPDYLLSTRELGKSQVIDCKIGRLGIRGGTTDFYGESHEDAGVRVRDLQGVHHDRFLGVANNLSTVMDQIDLMSDGAELSTAIEWAGEAYLAPVSAPN